MVHFQGRLLPHQITHVICKPHCMMCALNFFFLRTLVSPLVCPWVSYQSNKPNFMVSQWYGYKQLYFNFSREIAKSIQELWQNIKIAMGTEDLCLHSPPWQQKIFSSTMAATGKQLKQSVKVFHSFMLYRRLPDRIGKKNSFWAFKTINYICKNCYKC